MRLSSVMLAGCLLLVAAGSTHAQRTKSTDGEPCCGITAIARATGLVTATDPAGKAFQFRVSEAALLRSLRVGQKVYADFATGQVRIHGATPCCGIVQTGQAVKPAEPVGAAQKDPAEPINTQKIAKPADPVNGVVTAVDQTTGIATATEIATARTFRFEIKDKQLLASLKIGQKIFADFGSSKVRIHGGEPCCNIIGHGVN